MDEGYDAALHCLARTSTTILPSKKGTTPRKSYKLLASLLVVVFFFLLCYAYIYVLYITCVSDINMVAHIMQGGGALDDNDDLGIRSVSQQHGKNRSGNRKRKHQLRKVNAQHQHTMWDSFFAGSFQNNPLSCEVPNRQETTHEKIFPPLGDSNSSKPQ